MKKTKFFLGLALGAAAGYVCARAWQANAIVREGRSLQPSTDAHAYGRTQRSLAVAGALRGAITTLAFAYAPFSRASERGLRVVPPWLRPGIYFGALTVASAALDLPVSIIEDYALERKYGLSEQTLDAFVTDYAKSTAIGAGVAGGLAMLGDLALSRTKGWWPLVAAAGTLPLYILANLIVPLYILPLFNRFEPLTGPLETRLRALATRFGVGDAEILRMDMSRQTKKANAFVAGVGSTHRIVLGDTLIEHFAPDEIEFVVAHELGHYVSRDTWRMIGLAETVTALLLCATAALVRDDESAGSIRLMRIAAWFGTGMLVARPAINSFSRSREWAADRFALDVTSDPNAGSRAFRRLRDQNLAEEDVPAWYEAIFASHPSLGKRIGALEAEQV
jgi:STE24 endopeptidase